MEPYPYSDDYISVNEAVRYISEVVYPDLHLTTAKKRVRDRIKKAADKEDLRIIKRQPSNEILAIELFTWAGQQKKWGILYQVPGLPIRPNSGSANLDFAGISVVASGVQIPIDRQELESHFTELHGKHDLLLTQYEQLEQKYFAAVEALRKCRKKKAVISEKNSENAKKPRPK